MDTAAEIITRFYTCFAKKDSTGMNACYTEDIIFFDPIFDLLKGDEVRYMWDMLCKNAVDFSLTFDNIQDLGDNYYTCDWVANYTYSATNRKVVNKVKANMKIANGKILEHSDAFSMHKWSVQAIGFAGWLLGWNTFFQKKVKNEARKKLLSYMQEV